MYLDVFINDFVKSFVMSYVTVAQWIWFIFGMIIVFGLSLACPAKA